MGSPVFSVVMLLAGVALAARSIHVSPEGPSGGFYLSLVICGAAVFMLVRAIRSRRARSLRAATLTMREAMERWRSREGDGIFDPPARRWGDAFGGGVGLSTAGSEFRDAARALLISCEEDPHKLSGSRRALRSACRRTHFRGAVPAPQPKRHRVRARPRLVT